jgi:hypothetical protein
MENYPRVFTLINFEVSKEESDEIEHLRKELGIRDIPSLLIYLVHREYQMIEINKEMRKNPPFGALSTNTGTPLDKFILDRMKEQQGI